MLFKSSDTGTYDTIDIYYKISLDEPDCYSSKECKYKTIEVIYKNDKKHITNGYSRVIIGPLSGEEKARYRSITLKDHTPVEYILFLVSKTGDYLYLDPMYCIGEYSGTEYISKYLIFCDEWPINEIEKEKMLTFNW